MLTLCMDTAYKYLSLSLIKDGEIIAAIDEPCFKKQSELLFVRLQTLFEEAHLKPLDIDSVCISEGPGSYTGVRIAMSVAKTICEVAKLDLYKISTLRLYANNQEDTMVVLDARAKRAYVGIYDHSKIVMEDQVQYVEEIELGKHHLIGDLSLFGQEDYMPKISECFKNTQAVWEKQENIAYMVPKYLKESDSYYR